MRAKTKKVAREAGSEGEERASKERKMRSNPVRKGGGEKGGGTPHETYRIRRRIIGK